MTGEVKIKPTLHLIGLPHTQTVEEQMTVCAFTQKVVKFGEMMTARGYEIVLYSGEHNETVCSEHVPVFTDEQQRSWYGNHDPNLLPTIATWNVSDRHWVEMNSRVIAEISKRIEPHDIILLLAGLAQQPIANAFPDHLCAEWAVGYEGAFAPYRCYESHAWKHYLWGKWGVPDGRWYDAVIPNYFRAEDFTQAEHRDDYLLFVGRMTPRKGPHVAAQIAVAAGRPIFFAGSGVVEHSPGRIVCEGNYVIEGDGVEYVGVVGVKERNALMSRAHALFTPTIYIEPFGAVQVEAQMCGTPVLTTDWGAFTETVEDGVTGYRFRTLQEGVDAVEAVGSLDSDKIRQRALSRYSLEAIGPQYERWFDQLSGLWGKGWDALREPTGARSSLSV